MHLLILSLIFFFTGAYGGVKQAIQSPEIRARIPEQYHRELAAVLIFQNEASYLKEWIEYHHLLGIEYFYLYNNLSTDDYKEVLQPYINRGIVNLIEYPKPSDNIPSWNAVQCSAYTEVVERAVADKVKWLAIIDSDEFLVPRNVNSLKELLKNYEDATTAGVRVYWVMFGTSYVEKIPPDKTMIETLLLNEGYVQGMWKSIVRPVRVDPKVLCGCHTPTYLPGYHDIALPFEEIQCNHYWTRDEHYLLNYKIPRRILWGTSPEICLRWRDIFNQSHPADMPILRFVDALRTRLGL